MGFEDFLRIKFRDELAVRIIEEFPNSKDLYKKGYTLKKILDELSIIESLGYDSKVNNCPTCEDSLRRALKGFKNLEGELIIGLFENKYEYDSIAQSNIHTKGMSSGKRIKMARDSNNIKIENEGGIPVSDNELYCIWSNMRNPQFLTGKVKRIKLSKLTNLINEEFHNGNEIRNSRFMKTKLTYFKKVREEGNLYFFKDKFPQLISNYKN